ncbi:hypothetical protein [Afifella sp. IM 167]|uniref:hypothetical protein n=1 Tax=Afifella sp. IM 167 TaxID=2033586 RepID=UPI001CCC3B97|nr:hypothetical protein [Afifella sp. IM 167]
MAHVQKESPYQSQHHDREVAERLRERYNQIGIPAVKAAAGVKSAGTTKKS